jgi:pyruvate dehydrogenase E2 component (dihydrolipoamide acetyltransferase)
VHFEFEWEIAMATEIYLVKVGMTMTEGIVEEWCVPDGGHVEQGQLLYRLETEKINLDVDADATGIVKHAVAAGVTMKPGDVIGHIYAVGEAIPSTGSSAPTGATATTAAAPTAASAPRSVDMPSVAVGGRVVASPAARRLAAELNIDVRALSGSGPNGRIVETDVRTAAASPRVAAPPVRPAAAVPTGTVSASASPSSPVARRSAAELGVDLAHVQGTGPGGRITKEDVERAAASGAAAPAPSPASPSAARPTLAPSPGRQGGTAPADRIAVKGIRKTIATRMFDSLRSSAQLTMDMDVAMNDSVKLREQLIAEWESAGVRPTYTDLVVKAAAKALTQHPLMNSVFADTEIALLGDIHVGIAVAIDAGLVVPVIRHADRLSVREIAVESARLAAAARGGTLGLDDMAGGTFTVSALGMYGVDSFTPILNAPQSGILGVNRIRDDVGWDGERPIKRKAMCLSLTWDHRVLDGAPAAQFLGTVRDLLEAPYRLLV